MFNLIEGGLARDVWEKSQFLIILEKNHKGYNQVCTTSWKYIKF